MSDFLTSFIGSFIHAAICSIEPTFLLFLFKNKNVLISLSNKEGQKEEVLKIGKTLADLGFTLVGTQGTSDFYNANGIRRLAPFA